MYRPISFLNRLEDKLNELAQANQTHRVLPKWLDEDELYQRAIAISPPISPKMSLTPSETGSPPPHLDQISPQEHLQSPITTPSRTPSIRRSSTAEPPHASHKPARITKNTSKKTRRSASNTKASRRRVHQMVTRSMAQQTKLREFG